MRRIWRTLFVPAIFSLVIFSCQREVDGDLNPGNGGGNPVPGETVTAGIRGIVVDENDLPVQGATVTAGTQTTSTDRYGVFRFNNVSLLKANGFVRVTRNGYFNSTRSFPAVAGRIHNLRLKLIPKQNSGNFNSTTGGTVTGAGGAKLIMPANAIVDNSGAAYNGTVNIAMTWIDPTSPELTDIIPGDLRGINTGGNEVGLQTFGMIGVEMSTMGGQPLKVAAGKTAELSFPIPAALVASAPGTIDLWHFDEATGRWKQEGQATKTGSMYVGQVSHFSFWNCDAPFPLVDLCMNLVHSTTSQPLNNVQVRIYRSNNSYGSGYTDSAGNLCGKVPKDEPLVLKVMDPCYNVAYTQNIGPFSSNTNLGTIQVNLQTGSLTIQGTVTNCAGGNVTNGSAIIFIPTGHSYSVPVTAGSFSFTLLRCDPNPITISVLGVDHSVQQQGIPVTATGTTGTLNVGTIHACGTSSEQFMDFLIDGTPFVYATPADNFHTVDSSWGTPPPFNYTPRASKTNNMMASFSFSTNGVAAAGLPMTYLYLASPVGNSFNIVTPSPTLTLTSIGPPVTGFMEGNFNVVMDFSGTPRNVSCNFRVRRP